METLVRYDLKSLNRRNEALRRDRLARLRRVMPRRRDRAQPYWVVIAVDPHGHPTGEILCIRPSENPTIGGLAFYETRAHAELAATRSHVGPAQELLGVPTPGIRWEARGARRSFIETLWADGTLSRQNAVLARPVADAWVAAQLTATVTVGQPWWRRLLTRGRDRQGAR
jgi:hypothetical protein